MEEYASNRFTLFCTSAPTLPKVMESAAAIKITQNSAGMLMTKTIRSKTAKAAAFGPVDIRPTMGAGAPSYTSGVQTWKGAAETLKQRPMRIRVSAVKARAGVEVDSRPWAMA